MDDYMNMLWVVTLVKQAPVSGSKKPAEDGQLIFLTAGEYSSSSTNNLAVLNLARKRSWYMIFSYK